MYKILVGVYNRKYSTMKKSYLEPIQYASNFSLNSETGGGGKEEFALQQLLLHFFLYFIPYKSLKI